MQKGNFHFNVVLEKVAIQVFKAHTEIFGTDLPF